MKKIKSYLVLFLLFGVSIYSTNASLTKLKENDSIMKEIRKSKEKYEVAPVNAKVEEEKIIPGINGIEIDYDKSYHNMKKYGSYNESLTVLKEVSPDISLGENYEYPISKGNETKREVAIILKVEENPEQIMKILKEKEVVATFFLDGEMVEEYASLLTTYKENEYEILSFQKKYIPSFLKASRSYLKTITDQKQDYCYLEEENKSFEKHCKKEKLHIIKPTHISSDNIYLDMTRTLENGLIFSIEGNTKVSKELPSMIDYIKKRGYKMVTLSELLKESL